MLAKEREFHRKAAAKCFNEAWELLEKRSRSDGEDRDMLSLAHASRYHWGLVGSPRNLAVGDWQLSRVYAAIGEPALALAFAESCLYECKKSGLADIMCTAYEAMARACAVAKDAKRAMYFVGKAHGALSRSGLSASDKKVYSAQIQEAQNLIVQQVPAKWDPFPDPPH